MSARSQRWWTRRISLDRAVNRTTEWVRVGGMNERPHQRDDTPRRHHPTTCPRNMLRRAEFRITLPPRNEGGVTPEGWARKALLRALGSTPGSDAHFTRCLEVFVPHRFDRHTGSAAALAAIVAANFRQSAVSTLPAAHASGVPNARALPPSRCCMHLIPALVTHGAVRTQPSPDPRRVIVYVLGAVAHCSSYRVPEIGRALSAFAWHRRISPSHSDPRTRAID